jgi:hypothetical protein
MITGMVSPFLSAVFALKSVQNFGMTIPAEASLGPGFASPPGNSILTTFAIRLAT